MVQILDAYSDDNNPDLNKPGQTSTSNNYFTVPVPGLKLGRLYSFQFQWVYPDGTVSSWSPGYKFTTNSVGGFNKPQFRSQDLAYFQGLLKITWTGKDYTGNSYPQGFDRINIWVKDNSSPSNPWKVVGILKDAGTFSIAVPPKSHSVRLTAVTVTGVESDYSDTQTTTASLTPPASPTGVTAAWSKTDFTVTFSSDPSATGNEYLKEYLITLNTASSGTKVFSLNPVSGSSQKFALSLEANQAAFGTAEKAFSGSVETLDIYGNRGTPVTFANTVYVSSLTTPTITVSAITNGYSVSYPSQTSNVFQFISIEEVTSNSATDPGTGYVGVKTDTGNPTIVPTQDTSKRWVRARLFDNLNAYTAYSTAVSVTPLNPVTVDNVGPDNVSTVTVSSGVDTSGYLGFNAYADISWTAVTGGGIRGYRIRFSNDNGTTYSYVDSPGTGTTYRLGGLAIGATYKIAVATYDEYNNTSTSYVAGPDVTVTGTPSVSNYITGGPFQFGVGVGGVSTNKGLYFDTSNYWYINASNSARLKVGGASSNYLLWDGSTFAIDGNITARQGTFSGNVQIASGGSLYSGTTGQSTNNAGYILNTSGLRFDYGAIQGITTIDAATGKLTTSSANIGGWDVSSSQIYKTSGTNTVSLDPSGSISISGTGYTTGLAYPDASNIVFWAGSSKASAPFRVYKDGSVYLSSMVSGSVTDNYATTTQLGLKADTATVNSQLQAKASTDLSNVGSSTVESKVTIITGGKVQTGIISSTGYTYDSNTGYASQGTAINLDNGNIISKEFKIVGGSASFKGTLDVGISITSPQITGGYIQIGDLGSGNWNFKVDSSGNLYAKSGTFEGNVQGGTFSLSGYTGTNYWSSGTFNAGTSSTYLNVSASSGTVTLRSAQNQSIDVDEGGGLTSYAIDQKIVVDNSTVLIQGIPGVGNGLTYYGDLLGTTSGVASFDITRYWGDTTAEYSPYPPYSYIGTRGQNSNRTLLPNAGPSYNYGAAARYRMVVADPYDNNKLKRGFGVYYGVKSTVPGPSTGFVGDIWVSW